MRLVEREMVDRLGVSRTGVRTALQSLDAEGLRRLSKVFPNGSAMDEIERRTQGPYQEG
jgi:DNA-binding GntR family transcriptional regulator